MLAPNKKLSRQQIDLLINQLSIFHVNMTVTHEKLQKMNQRLFMMFSKSSSTRKEVWAELRQKKKHDRVNAQALTAAKAAERDAKQRNKQKKKNSETAKQRNEQKKKNSEITVSLSSNLSSFFASSFVIMTFKFRSRSKDSKNLTSITNTTTTTFNESSFSFISSVMTRTIKSDRAVKKKLYESRSFSLDVVLKNLRWR